MDLISKLIAIIEIVILLSIPIILIFLVRQRMEDKKKETFEDRDW
ncbi:hypothetical protein [Candidatus Nitrosacidococcus sp. I8]|nr:hypothetical protein [Candidatus Nitrosacidococcus sp. I8]CAH9018652.1 hypothetical protein NURINAE_01053 [Candidatus Nitrosacidococcus sp. I8]